MASFSKSLYPYITSLDFSISFVDLFFTFYTILVLKIQISLYCFILYYINLKTSLLASISISNISDSLNDLLGAVIMLSWQSLTTKLYKSFSF
jgi:hypothetical protein